jgi:tetratricopeptide (TPR) repeat protein
MMGQALFAQGQFEPAAGIIQAGMNQLPESQWGGVVSNYTQLYGNPQDFTNQLKSLENARTASPDSPALRFLLGYEYGYLNYPQQASRELDKAIQLNPRDPFAASLRNEFGAKIGLANVPLPKPEQPAQGGAGPAVPAGNPQTPVAPPTPLLHTTTDANGAPNAPLSTSFGK